jgi:2-(3-amino-3-carboxypropyl)histidine synthase
LDINVNLTDFFDSFSLNFTDISTRITLCGTIQYVSSLSHIREKLNKLYNQLRVPQIRSLSPGEVLGCTSPIINDPTDFAVFLADGRFHMESFMIASPNVPMYRYDPFAKILTYEKYDQQGMRAMRRAEIQMASRATYWGIAIGAIGRQGNPCFIDKLQQILTERGIHFLVILVTEITPQTINLFKEIETWVQIACPRISIDWAESFNSPMLTPYEALVTLTSLIPFWKGSNIKIKNGLHAYPMCYYAKKFIRLYVLER